MVILNAETFLPSFASAINGDIYFIKCRQFSFIFKPGAVARSDAHPPGTRTVAGSIFTSDNIPSWRLVMK